MHSRAYAPEARSAVEQFGASPFVARAILALELPVPSTILDIPCGFGRHTLWFADLGHQVVAADIDPQRVAHVRSALAEATHPGKTVVLDARSRLPFEDAAFDGAIVIDYVEPALLAQMARFLRPGGFLIYETFSARGDNWRGLLLPGEADEILGDFFNITARMTREVGVDGDRRETTKITARRTEKLP